MMPLEARGSDHDDRLVGRVAHEISLGWFKHEGYRVWRWLGWVIVGADDRERALNRSDAGVHQCLLIGESGDSDAAAATTLGIELLARGELRRALVSNGNDCFIADDRSSTNDLCACLLYTSDAADE